MRERFCKHSCSRKRNISWVPYDNINVLCDIIMEGILLEQAVLKSERPPFATT